MAKRPKVTAKKIVNFALSKKAEDVMLLDLRKVTPMTDFFVICTGVTDVQVRAIADAVIDGCKKQGIGVHHVEGIDSLRWVLIDTIDIVVHIFQPEVRKYYQLERLWGDAIIEKFSYEDEGAVS